MAIAVNTPSAEITELAKAWAVLEPLMGGTPAMRQASTRMLPQWPNEETAAYAARLATATLFPAYRRTVTVMAGKPFAKALTLSDDAPPSIVQWADDVDLQGNNLHSFAAEMFEESFYGLAGVLVEYPRVPAAEGPRTVAQVERSGQRPYLVRVKHRQILGWRSALVGGRLQLTQLRIAESRDVEDGDYGTTIIPQVRVLRPGSWELWEQAGKGSDWTLVDKGTTSLPVIPFVPIYGHREGFMLGSAPLLDLAYLNIKHWQSQSDQDTILHVARVPILAMIGADEDSQLTVGGSAAVKLPLTADMKFVEHSGAAIGAGAQALTDLEQQMIQAGAELLVKQPGDRSATESANDAEANKCELQRLTEQFEDALDQALWLMAQYVRLPSAGSVSLFKDFGAATQSDAMAQLVADLNARGIIPKRLVLQELQRRGVIEASVDIDAAIAEAEDEGPALGMVPAAPPGDDPADA